jgi:hypothetical protein
MDLLPSSLVLEDLPDDLLRLCARGPSSDPLGIKDVMSFDACNKRLHALVQGGGVLRELTVVVETPIWKEDEWTGEVRFSRQICSVDLSRRLDPHNRNTIYLDANKASLSWLCSWPLLRGPPLLERVEVDIRSMGEPAADPPPPELWRRLRDLLSPTAVELNCSSDVSDLKLWFGEEQVLWLAGCPRLRRARVDFGTYEMVDDYSEEVGLGDGGLFHTLAPLMQLQELDLSAAAMGLADPTACAPLAALSSLTALTLPLAKWDEPFGPLPPGLASLTLSLVPTTRAFHLQMAYGSDRFAAIPTHLSVVPLPLACPGLKDSLGPVAASLRRLSISMYTEYATEVNDDYNCFTLPYSLHLALTPDSIPCAFPGLEEFTFRLEHMDAKANNHCATLTALLEAAPSLRRIWLIEVANVALETMEWLSERRPGFRVRCPAAAGEGGKVIVIPQ